MTDRTNYRAYDREYEKNRPSRRGERVTSSRTYNLKHRYGITEAEFDVMLVEQGGTCKTCPKTPEDEGRSLHLDHDHADGRVRGILCSQCNTHDTLA